ncbi:protein trichome birefringence-like 19 [Nicotiana attenuata]|uniref:Protein trichome birefringence-like 19 n=1 Tax=Nicotiana attenuata TaxID=49451 RepID=A0A1J6ILY6_NICAT|nr:protein trichome birefringence-like 19 [Nicotiana attenuata]
MELPFVKYSTSAQRTPRIFILIIVLAVTVLGLIPLYHPFNWYPADLLTQNPSEISPTYHAEEHKIKIIEPETCDIFSGEWVWNPDDPYYTNVTCSEIHEHQNCMKYGRPDTDYLKWRWKPNGCELHIFNPFQFLDMVRNKSLAIVGDSVGRNQMQSLICLLGRVPFSSLLFLLILLQLFTFFHLHGHYLLICAELLLLHYYVIVYLSLVKTLAWIS